MIDSYTADVANAQDYYPFGMQMPGRTFTEAGASNYRYGFNGQEKDDEIKGAGNSYTAEFWEYDPRIGRRWNLDPVLNFRESGYATFGNNPIYRIDPLGNKDTVVNGEHGSTSKALPEFVVKGKRPFSKKVLDRIRSDAETATMGHLKVAYQYEAKFKELKEFAKNSVAQSFGDMLLLSRYQRQNITLGERMISLIEEDDNFKKFEAQALAAFR